MVDVEAVGIGPTLPSRTEGDATEAYAAFAEPVFTAFSQMTTVTKESDVAEAVLRAAIVSSGQLRFPAGPDAMALSQSN
jgi:hypothetical protein